MDKKNYRITVFISLILSAVLLFTACGDAKTDETEAQTLTQTQVTTSATTEQSTTQAVTASEAPTEETTDEETQPEASMQTTQAPYAAEYRLDCEGASFSPGESFSVVLSINCADFCSGSCYISFDSSILSCTEITPVEIEGVNRVYDDEALDDGLAVISFYSASPVALDYSRVAVLEFTVLQDAKEDTVSSVAFSEGTLCMIAEDEQGIAISDISESTDYVSLEYTII